MPGASKLCPSTHHESPRCLLSVIKHGEDAGLPLYFGLDDVTPISTFVEDSLLTKRQQDDKNSSRRMLEKSGETFQDFGIELRLYLIYL
jgi:hypothetical protein